MTFLTAMARVLTLCYLMHLGSVAMAQPVYPSKPIRFIVPYPPGGTNNLLARMIGQKLTENWGQQVLVDNRPGANTVIGTDILAKSAPDGYSIMAMSGTHIINALLNPALPFDPIKDFAPVGTIASQEYLLVVHPSLPVTSFKDFVALAKAKPGQLNFATAGNGSVSHLATEMLAIMTGARVQSVPYKGSGPALTELLGGQVQVIFQPPFAVIGHIKSGRLRGIAISGAVRSAALPQIPTFAESGLPGFSVKNWNGILAPAGTPRPLIDKLSSELASVLATRSVRDWLQSQSMQPFVSTPEQFAELMQSELVTYGKVIKTANIKMGG
jgi:tripartite-type tricarboxylate transporter receptor subunit TctC